MKNFIYILLAIASLTSCSMKLTESKKIYVKKELEEMRKTDQIAANHWEKEWTKYKDSIFTANKIIAEKMFNDYGFLGFDKVEKDGS